MTEPAVVLGSTQRLDVVDTARAAAAGVDVVRRRGGGGAVLVGPEEIAWVDVFVPAGDELWSADVAVAFHWLGAAWTGALADIGIDAAGLRVPADDRRIADHDRPADIAHRPIERGLHADLGSDAGDVTGRNRDDRPFRHEFAPPVHARNAVSMSAM